MGQVAGNLDTVPFFSLEQSHTPLRDAILSEVADLLTSGSFINGPAVAEFESAFAGYCGTAHCVGVASGLDGIRLALLAAGVGPGDEVVVPTMTFAATAEAVTQAGAAPVLVDVLDEDCCIDAAAVGEVVTERTRAVIPVHLYGQMADLAPLERLAQVAIVEDACQAHGASRDELRAGVAGSAGAFSFYPSKNLGAMGDAGALLTDDAGVAAQVRALREHGQRAKYDHELGGYTSRLDTLQAVVLLRKLPHLDRWNAERAAAAAFYSEALVGVGDLELPTVPAGSRPVWHLYVVLTEDPDGLAAFLRERRIGTGRHYPRPVHLEAAYASLGHEAGRFPVAEDVAARCLSLPLFPGIGAEQLETVAGAVRAYFGTRRTG